MIPIYNHRGDLMMALQKADLLRSADSVKSIVRGNLGDCENILLLDNDYNSIGLAGEVEDEGVEPKLGVILQGGQTTLEMQPIQFFVKRTDKRGAILKGNPFVSVDYLTQLIAQTLQIPQASQELYYQGAELEDPSQTLLQLKLRSDSVIHVLDLRMVHYDPERKYSIQLQGAKYPSKTVALEVTCGMKLGELKQKASQIYGIPADKVAIGYLSMVLDNNDYTVSYYNIVENSQVKILDDREATIERIQPQQVEPANLRLAMHKPSSRDSKRPPPNFQIRRTDSIEWYEYRMFSQTSMISQQGSIMEEPMRMMQAQSQTQSPYFKSDLLKNKLKQDVRLEIHPSKSQAASDDGHKIPTPQLPNSSQTLQIIQPPGQKISGRASAGSAQPQSQSNTLQLPLIPQYRVHSAPRPTTKIQQFEIDVQDLESNHFKVNISQIDTIRQVKTKLFFINPEFPPKTQVLIYDGKLLEDDQVVRDIGNTQITSLFLIKREGEQ